MNPPSALHGAMSRDRKPFTYTPGGLNLSEIKSERMAKRLMRNAMNQGVPEKPVQMIQSPPMPSTPIAVPNYNCLPVQVFPTFNLPANPKSLLRTRSNPDQPRDFPIQRVPPPIQYVNNSNIGGREYHDTFNKKTPSAYTQINNNRPVSMYEYSAVPSNTNYGSDGHTFPGLPEISYEAEYLQAPRKIKTANIKLPSQLIKEEKVALPVNENTKNVCLDIPIEPPLEKTDALLISKPIEDETATDNKQKEVKIVKKQVKKEQKVEDRNGDQNGNADIEAELTVKLPTKKTAAKTETKVEVVKKTLPDGSVQEVKTTITKTTIDGKTEIRTRTETKTIPKEEDNEEEVVEDEEEEENGEVVVEEVQDEREQQEIEDPKSSKTITESTIKENGHENNIVKTEERSETTTTKKVVVVQNTAQEEPEEEVQEEEEIVEEAEPVIVVIKKPVETTLVQEDTNDVEEEEPEEVEEEEEVNEDVEEVKVKEVQTIKQDVEEVEEEVEEEEVEEEEEEKGEVNKEKDDTQESGKSAQKDEEEEVEEEEVSEEEYEEAKEDPKEEAKEEAKEEKIVRDVEKQSEALEKPNEEDEAVEEDEQEKDETSVEKVVEEPEVATKVETVVPIIVEKEEKKEPVEVKLLPTVEAPTAAPQLEYNIPLRDPSVPLEKVEDVEIKPIGLPSATISKSHTENTEIITSTTPFGPVSTQTEYNKIENIVTVNRTTKILDHSYENLTQQGIPTVKTYFAPSSRDRVLASPLPSRPYQPVYPPEPQTERRHSLLLERLSMERQMPADIYQNNNYQYNNQAYEEQTQYSQEPQSEVLTVSNVKPSTIKNQDWFQQSRRENIIYNNLTPSTPAPPPPSTPLWSQPQTRSQPQPQPQPQTQPPAQPYVQPQPQYQPSYTETISQDRSNTYQQSAYTPYTPKPTWGSNVINVDPLPSINTPSPHPYISKDTTDSYQTSTQQYSSSYVPPPWEQDSSYVVDNSNQNYYQPPPSTTTYSPTQSQSWKPAPASNKFSKPTPTAYIPPAPNQSFVVPVNVEPPRLPGRKTYYSEYERRYISVPEATYIPAETKYQPQPDPSPQYYYDNNEPNEVVEHEWRKELREFTEKSTKTEQQIEQTNVKPPWEVDTKHAKTLPTTYTPTPTWSQTVRPRSWRERSYDAEYIGSQELPKTNTLGRGRPLSSTYGKTNIDAPIPERTRGVSVDRYNPNNYQSPIAAEHPPVLTHTLSTPAPHATYHNPNVPSYHARASAEPRGQQVYQQPRTQREPQPSPFQSRSFKYLQWITGTED